MLAQDSMLHLSVYPELKFHGWIRCDTLVYLLFNLVYLNAC